MFQCFAFAIKLEAGFAEEGARGPSCSEGVNMFKNLIIASAAAVAVAVSAVPSMAQDWQASPTYGSVSLTTGFTPDPHYVGLRSGGPINVAQTLGGACRGFVANAPDFDLYFTGGSNLPLAISVDSAADTTLVINDPNGNWYCDDDSGDGLNPSIVFSNPASGLYDIWVGTYSSASLQDATLAISELSTY